MKKIFAIAVAAALLVGITALAYGAKGKGKGPAEKATGGVETAETNAWRFSFNAHEGPNADGTDGKGQLTCTSNVLGTGWKCVVKYVNVAPTTNKAWFAGQVTQDSVGGLINRWLVVEVLDGGTPGRNGDQVAWGWWGTTLADEASAMGDVVDGMITGLPATGPHAVTKGNLVVHP